MTLDTSARTGRATFANWIGRRAGISDFNVLKSAISKPSTQPNPFPINTALRVQLVCNEGRTTLSDPSTYWLTITNVGLGVVTLICCIAVAFGVVQELAAKRKKKAAFSTLDHEVSDLAASFGDGHAFQFPQLGLTMADGGEPTDKKQAEKDKER